MSLARFVWDMLLFVLALVSTPITIPLLLVWLVFQKRDGEAFTRVHRGGYYDHP